VTCINLLRGKVHSHVAVATAVVVIADKSVRSCTETDFALGARVLSSKPVSQNRGFSLLDFTCLHN
jgi:hypothetical protein